MESTPNVRSKTGPRDFFLWLGAIVALYGSITSFIALLFSYIDRAFPDVLGGFVDPYGGPLRFSIAALIVLVPTTIALMFMLRRIILGEPGKANIWVRRWALGLTIFIAAVTILVDLVTLINTFLGGEITVRFGLKVLVVLLVAIFVFFHTLADWKGYWIEHGGRARLLAIAVALVTFITIGAGFFIIGSPSNIRNLRLDEQKVNDLRSIQYQLIDYWRVKQQLPDTLDTLKDPLSDTVVPMDPQTNAPYSYQKTGATSFTLCADFNAASRPATVTPSAPVMGPGGAAEENWQHQPGRACFTRTIDPQKYPRLTAPAKGL